MHVDAKMPLQFELSDFVPIDTGNIAQPSRPGGGATLFYGPYRYVRPLRVWLFRHFGQK